MYAVAIAQQLRVRGHDVTSIHDAGYRHLEAAEDAMVFEAARAEGRVLVTENVGDFWALATDALAYGKPAPGLIFTTDRQFPRGDQATIGRLVLALATVIE